VSRCTFRPAQAVTVSSFDATAKYRQRTEHAHNVTTKPTFDTLRGHESHQHCHDTVLRYVVTLQVCTHFNTPIKNTRNSTFIPALCCHGAGSDDCTFGCITQARDCRLAVILSLCISSYCAQLYVFLCTVQAKHNASNGDVILTQSTTVW
jgi:hypothetical protein